MYFIKNNSAENTPSSMRNKSFYNYFKKRVSKVIYIEEGEKLFFNRKNLFKSSKEFVFISMPPFSNFWVFFIPNVRVILDIRDGWSIAQNTGYGGITKPKPIKAKVTRIIEYILANRACMVITCTNGLQQYLEEVTKKQVLLIPNGISDEDFQLAEQAKYSEHKEQSEKYIFCCAGQFSEYGEAKAKKICKTIFSRYSSREILIQLIGSSEKENAWVVEYMKDMSGGKAFVEILPKKSRKELYKLMADANYGLVVLRDPSYDFGTKVYDYIALGLPIVNYFDKPNNFTNYFDICLDEPFGTSKKVPEIRRSKLISNVLDAQKDFQ